MNFYLEISIRYTYTVPDAGVFLTAPSGGTGLARLTLIGVMDTFGKGLCIKYMLSLAESQIIEC